MGKRPALPDPAEVLRGRSRVTIEQLFALIHAANPTDRGLSTRQEAERYALKARLQSLLSREHSSLLQVMAEGAEGRVVSLQHRIGQRDACHARIDALDEEARRWVEGELSAPPTPIPAAAAPAKALPPGKQAPTASADPLAAGQRAMDEYDFDEAAARFRVALGRPGLAVEAARALLDLLVNHLADDAAALGLESSLPAPARTDPLVLGRLAIAAARQGDPRSRRWLRLADPESAVEALILLSDGALRGGKEEDLRSCVGEIVERSPHHPALLRLQAAQAALRKAAREPMEERLRAATQAESWAEVEALVAALQRWPESEAARGAKILLDQRRDAQEARNIVSRAWEAWHRGENEAVLVAVRQARVLAATDPETLEWLAEAEEAAIEEANAADLVRLQALFAAGRLPEALSAWPRLRPEVQAELRERHPLPELDWLSQLPAGEVGVAAAMALHDASRSLRRGDLSTTEQLLVEHERALRGHPVAASLRESVALLRLHAQQQATSQRLREVQAARREGRLDEALALCQSLPVDLRRRHRLEIEAERAAREAAERRAQALERGDLLEARGLAVAAGDSAAVEVLDIELRAAWRVERHEGVDIGVADVVIHENPIVPLPWITETGDAFVYVQVCAGWVVARVIELGTLRVRAVVMLWALPPFRLHYVHLEGDTVTLVDLYGGLLAFRLSDGMPLRHLPRPLQRGGEYLSVESTVLAPGGRFLWMTLHIQNTSELRVYDTERWPSFRRMDGFGLAVPLLGNEQPVVARLHAENGASLHAPNGNPAGRRSWSKDAHLTRACIHPAGFPLCLTVNASAHRGQVNRNIPGYGDVELVADPLGLFIPGDDRFNGRIEIFGLARISEPHQIAASREEGALYLKELYNGIAHLHRFVPARPGGMNLEDEGGPWAPASTVLLTDVSSRRVRAITRTPQGLREVDLQLGPPYNEPIDVSEENYRVGWTDMGLSGDLGCGFTHHDLSPTGEALLRLLRGKEGAARETFITDIQSSQSEDVGTLFDLATALKHLHRSAEGNALFNETGARFPDHPRWRLVQATLSARENDWPGVLEQLVGISPERLDAAMRQHFLHLLAVARLRTGDREQGAADLHAAAQLQGRCHLEPPRQLLHLLDGAPAHEGPITDSAALCRVRLGPIVQGILSADRHLAAADPEAALASLDHALTWRSRDRQALARIAEAWLGIHTDDPVRRLRRRVALITFLGAMEPESVALGHELPIPPHTWEAARLADLERRVTEALMTTAGAAGQVSTGAVAEG